jgi:membrane-associated HD superfamily phosphohydrolase
MKILRKLGKKSLSALPLVMPLLALAQVGGAPTARITNITGVLCAINTVVNWLFFILIAVAVVFVIIAAFKYLTAGGDPEKVKSANHTLIYVVVAIVVAIIAKAIPLLVGSFFNISWTKTTCP